MPSYRFYSNYKQAILWPALTGLLVVGMLRSFMPGFAFISTGIILFPILLIFAAALGGILPSLAGVSIIAIGATTLYGTQGLLLLLYLLPLTIALLVCLEMRVPFFKTAAIVTAAFVVSLVLVFVMLQKMAGGNLYESIAHLATDSLDKMPLRDSFLYSLWRSGFLTHGMGADAQIFESAQNANWAFKPEVVSEFYKQIHARLEILLAGLFPGLLTNFSIFLGFLTTGLALKLANRYSTADDLDMPPFSLWFIPRQAGKAMMILALGYLVTLLSRQPIFQTTGQLMYNVFFSLYAIQGLAYSAYLLKRRGSKRVVRLVLLVLFYFILSPVAMLMGVYDQARDPRKLREAPPTSRSNQSF